MTNTDTKQSQSVQPTVGRVPSPGVPTDGRASSTRAPSTLDYPAKLRAIITDLTALQTRTEKSDALFARDHLSYSSSVWSKLQSFTYDVKDLENVTIQLAGDARRLNEELALSSRGAIDKFIDLDHCSAVMKAVKQCRTKTNEDRLVVYLAPTGGGKSTIAKQVRKEFNGTLVNAAESWRKNYMAVLKDIALAAGGNAQFHSEHDGEIEVIRLFRARRGVLIIDEGESFGPRTINLIKKILNETPTVVLLCTIEQFYQSWNKAAWVQALQLKRRTHVVIRCPLITPKDVAEFIPAALKFDVESQKPACILIAAAANAFGKYDFVSRIMTDLADEGPALIAADDTAKSVAKVQRYFSSNN